MWPSALSVISFDVLKILLRPTAHSYGVAGSPVVPMTMMGVVLIEVILFVVRVNLSLVGGMMYLNKRGESLAIDLDKIGVVIGLTQNIL